MDIKSLLVAIENGLAASKQLAAQFAFEETWADVVVKGMSTNYLVSNFGNVKRKNSKRALTIKRTPNRKLSVRLVCENGQIVKKSLHLLVAEAFVDNPHDYCFVEHLDGNIKNNHASNLAWYKSNKKYCANLTTALAKHTDKQIHQVCKLMQEGVKPFKIVKQLGVTHGLISSIRSGSCWRHISKHYIFPKHVRPLKKDDTIRKKNGHYTESAIRKVCELLTVYPVYSYSQIEKLTNVEAYTVCRINNKRTHPEITKDYQFHARQPGRKKDT